MNLDQAIGFSAKLRRNLSLLGVLCLAPFAVLNLLNGRIDIAILVIALMGVLSGSAWALHVHGRTFWSGGLVLSMVILAVYASTYFHGHEGIYWAYPAVLLCHLILDRKPALAVSLLFTLGMIPLAALAVGWTNALRVTATLLLAGGFSYVFADRHAKQQRKMSRLIRIDPLTGAFNRRHLEDSLENAVCDKDRYKRPISLILFDLDRFKQVNDMHGHKVGDDVLCWLVRTINKRVRKTDRLCRYGGDEFVLVMPQTSLHLAGEVARDIHRLIADSAPFEFPLSLSTGVAELCNGESAENWLRRADQALYSAKDGGRARVVSSPSTVAVNE